MALTGDARAHDPNMGAKADVVHCSLAPAKLDAGMRPRTGRGAVDAHMCDSFGTFGCERGWSSEMEATNE
jgi:hypothetical protein